MGWLEDELRKDQDRRDLEQERRDLELKRAKLQELEFTRLLSDFSHLFESISKIEAGLTKLGYRFDRENRRQIEGRMFEISIQLGFKISNTNRSLKIGFCASSKGLMMTVDTEGIVEYIPHGVEKSTYFLPDQSAELEAKFDDAFSSHIEFVRALTKEERQERESSIHKWANWERSENSRLAAEYEQKLRAWESEKLAWIDACRLEALPIKEHNRQEAIQWEKDRKEKERTWDLEENRLLSQRSIWERAKEIFKKGSARQNPFRASLNDNPFSNISVPLPIFPVAIPLRAEAQGYPGIYFKRYVPPFKPVDTPQPENTYSPDTYNINDVP